MLKTKTKSNNNNCLYHHSNYLVSLQDRLALVSFLCSYLCGSVGFTKISDQNLRRCGKPVRTSLYFNQTVNSMNIIQKVDSAQNIFRTNCTCLFVHFDSRKLNLWDFTSVVFQTKHATIVLYLSNYAAAHIHLSVFFSVCGHRV